MKKTTSFVAGIAALLMVGAMGCNKTEEPTTPPEGGAPGPAAGAPASPGAMGASPAAPASPGAVAPPGPGGAPTK